MKALKFPESVDYATKYAIGHFGVGVLVQVLIHFLKEIKRSKSQDCSQPVPFSPLLLKSTTGSDSWVSVGARAIL